MSSVCLAVQSEFSESRLGKVSEAKNGKDNLSQSTFGWY